jgi:hypothetical protein
VSIHFGFRRFITNRNLFARALPEFLIASGRSATGFPNVIGALANAPLKHLGGRLHMSLLSAIADVS